jgi:ring hydroxylating enzyme alpha subunit
VRAINWRFNSKVMEEDVELCDMVQLGLESRTYERGVLNRNENAVLHFHDQLREAVPGIDEA